MARVERGSERTHLGGPLAVEPRKVEAHLLDVGDLLALEAVEVGLDRLRGVAEILRKGLEGLVEL